MIRHPGESFVIFINIRFQKWLGFLLMHLLVSNWLVRFGNNCYDLSRSSLYCCSMYYQTWCLSLFHIKFLNVPNPELRRGFLAVFNRWEGLRKSKYISILQRSWGVLYHNLFRSFVIVLCNWKNLRLGHASSDVVAMAHKIHSNSKIAAASQKSGISWTVVAKYAKLQRHI